MDIIENKIEERIFRLWDRPPKSHVEQWIFNRQMQTVKQGLQLLPCLIEPYRSHKHYESVFFHSLQLHLYARILDDAIDEGLPAHRLQLLKAQPLLLESVTTLVSLFGGRKDSFLFLLHETVQAVEQEWNNPAEFEQWGVKNHHLLIPPLLLAPSIDEFEKYKNVLSEFIFILQIKDELKQSSSSYKKKQMLQSLISITESSWVESLRQGGWIQITDRLSNDLQELYNLFKLSELEGIDG